MGDSIEFNLRRPQIVGVLVYLICLWLLLRAVDPSDFEVKWIAYVGAMTCFGIAVVWSGKVRDSLFLVFVLSLQMSVALYLGSNYSMSSVGATGPGGFVVWFISIPGVALLLHHCLSGLVLRRPRLLIWGKEIGRPAAVLFVVTAMTVLYSPERWRVIYVLFEMMQLYLIFLVAINVIRTRGDIIIVSRLKDSPKFGQPFKV